MAHIQAYVKRYGGNCGGKSACEKMARIHNGGPSGCKKAATNPYWNGIRKCLGA